ncbi:MAG: membrane dipeptidase, partial [Deltaproteobacteria bacterium]|nr:membrane dipeptidase [Deltaproteobacteria bacterium]
MYRTTHPPRPAPDPAEYASGAAGDVVTKARGIHERVIVLDTHIDFLPGNLTGNANYAQRLETQFNLPKMIEGGLDAMFFIIYVGQTRETQQADALKFAGYERAYGAAIEKFNAVHRFVNTTVPDKMVLALTPGDVRRVIGEGKKAALMGVENGYPMGEE